MYRRKYNTVVKYILKLPMLDFKKKFLYFDLCYCIIGVSALNVSTMLKVCSFSYPAFDEYGHGIREEKKSPSDRAKHFQINNNAKQQQRGNWRKANLPKAKRNFEQQFW